MKNKTVGIVGLGYVGLPLAGAFSKHLSVIGFDIDEEKVKRLSESNTKENIEFTADPSKIKQADFVLICVPTPVTKSKEPDLRYVKLFCFAKTFTKKLLRKVLSKTLRRNMCFFGKAFFKPFRKAFTEIASLKERFAIKGLNEVGKVIKGSTVLIMGLDL